MSQTVNVHAAKTHLSALLAQVEAGEEVIIARAGKPVAKLVPVEPDDRIPVLGTLRGKVWIADDFDAPMTEDELALWEGPLTSPDPDEPAG